MSDHLGSVRVITDANGTLVSKQQFEPWSPKRSGSLSNTTRNIISQRRDSPGVVVFNARYDDPRRVRNSA